MNNITEPLILARGSHQAGSGKGCAMNVISWENGDTTITDYPACSDPMLSSIVQSVNDDLADSSGMLSPESSAIALDLGHATVGTTYHGLDGLGLRRVYTRCAVLAARKVAHLDTTGTALPAIEAAERWANQPTAAHAASAASTAYAAYAADAAADAADAASTVAFKINLAWEIIALFKDLTGTTSDRPLPIPLDAAVTSMLVRSGASL